MHEENVEVQKQESFFRETLRFAFITLLIVLPIRFFVAEPFIVSGISMDPTFKDADYLIVDRLSYHFEAPKRGEVIIFRPPKNESKYYIKRIIGLPGETVELIGTTVTIKNSEYPDGFTLDQGYIAHTKNDAFAITLKEGEYFVMGDNRPQSSDSRSWGPVPRSNITGRAILRLFPPSSVDIFPGRELAH
jgi:signal peptidase I